MDVLSQLGLPLSVTSFVDQSLDGPIEPSKHLWGFGGLHGGVTLALLATAMQRSAGAGSLRRADAQFVSPVRTGFEVTVEPVRTTSRNRTLAARATSDGEVLTLATALIGKEEAMATTDPWAPIAPVAPPPSACERFWVPPEFVPFAASTDIRPVGPNRPFAGGDDPTLIAWIRLVDDDTTPDVSRLAVLMDGLAPSYAAVLSVPTDIPTVHLSFQPSGLVGTSPSPWVLIAARTHAVTAGRWVDERIDAWAPDGTHLGTAHQFRLVLG
jgi:hypothetical protein